MDDKKLESIEADALHLAARIGDEMERAVEDGDQQKALTALWHRTMQEQKALHAEQVRLARIVAGTSDRTANALERIASALEGMLLR